MAILSCSSTLSVSRFQPQTAHLYLLPAPKEVKLLLPPRPRIVVERVPKRPLTRAELERQCGPIKTREEMRAEIAEIAERTIARLRAVREEYEKAGVA